MTVGPPPPFCGSHLRSSPLTPFRRSPSFDVTDKSSFQEREAAELALHLLSCGAAALRPDEYAESWVVGRAAVVEQGGEAGCLDVMGQSLCSAAFGEGCKLNVPGVGDLRRAAPNSWAAPSSGPLRSALVSSADGEPLPLVPDCLPWLNFGEISICGAGCASPISNAA